MAKKAKVKAEPKPKGRPTAYTPEIAAVICTQLAEGKSLRKICEAEGMPAPSTVYLWLQCHETFSEQYTRARSEQADSYADRIGDIAERAFEGEVDPNAARVAVDALKWAAGKLAPKKYGERVAVDHGVSDGLAELMKEIDGKSRGIPGPR